MSCLGCLWSLGSGEKTDCEKKWLVIKYFHNVGKTEKNECHIYLFKQDDFYIVCILVIPVRYVYCIMFIIWILEVPQVEGSHTYKFCG